MLLDVTREVRERERLRAHFTRALALVGSADATGLDDTRRAARAKNLERLRAYRDRGIFPRNVGFPDRMMPYFVDPAGRACAVAHLALEDGRDDVTRAVVRRHNHAYIAEMTAPELLAWAAGSGFSLDELAVIQPSYCPTNEPCMVGYGGGPTGEPCSYSPDLDGTPCGGDFDACTNGICAAGVCVASPEGVGCEDGNPCTEDHCDPSQGCIHTTADPAVLCNDHDPVTVESCHPVRGCEWEATLPRGDGVRVGGCAFRPFEDGSAWPLLLVAMAVHRLRRHKRASRERRVGR